MNHVPDQMYKCCLQFNNIATIQDVRYFATGRDDDWYVTIQKLDETTIGRYVFIFAIAQDDRIKSFGEMKLFRQMWCEQIH